MIRYAYVWSPTALFARYASFLRVALLIGLFFAFSNTTNAAEVNPLRPVDTSSPRATLQDFVVTMDEIYRGMKDILQEYAASERLYLTPDERRKQFETLSTAAKAIRVLDLSDIPPVLRDTVAAERAIQLKEILDRIEAPFFREHSGSGSDGARFVQAVAAAGNRDRHRPYRERTAFGRISRLRRHRGSTPRILRACQETALQARPGSRIERCLSSN